jgi:hypothetical protein
MTPPGRLPKSEAFSLQILHISRGIALSLHNNGLKRAEIVGTVYAFH